MEPKQIQLSFSDDISDGQSSSFKNIYLWMQEYRLNADKSSIFRDFSSFNSFIVIYFFQFYSVVSIKPLRFILLIIYSSIVLLIYYLSLFTFIDVEYDCHRKSWCWIHLYFHFQMAIWQKFFIRWSGNQGKPEIIMPSNVKENFLLSLKLPSFGSYMVPNSFEPKKWRKL